MTVIDVPPDHALLTVVWLDVVRNDPDADAYVRPALRFTVVPPEHAAPMLET
jgi:hypothetical protein